MKRLFKLAALGLILSTSAMAANNTMLQFTMKAISKDMTNVFYPSTQEPLDVTEEALVIAIARARTAAYQLNLVIDKKDDEMLPAVLQGASEQEKKEKLTLYSNYLKQAIEIVNLAEKQLLTERVKAPTERNFQAMIKTSEDIDSVIRAAHKVFNPQN